MSPYGDKTWAVAVDGSGNVVVTGTFYDTNYTNAGHYTAYTAKYAAADGALLWEKHSDGPANSAIVAFVRAVAVDKSDNVIVTGSSSNGTNDDYYTAKYAAADGALLWERRYNGPANLEDIAVALRVDGKGNVVVTGKSASRASPDGAVHDFYTARYAGADGALLWEKRYKGLVNGDDSASDLALGPNGMVVVTGSSDGTFGPATGYDYLTIVYREPLPPLTIDLIPTGVRFRFTGIPGRGYTIERAPVVTGPWNTINTQTAPASSLLEYIDANPPVGAAFYRTREP